MNTDMELLYEDHSADELQCLPTALEALGAIICNPDQPIPGLPCLAPDYRVRQEWIGNDYLAKTPWGAAQTLWGSDTKGLWSFVPLYRLVIPNDIPLPESQIPQIGYAVWDTVTGLVTVHAESGGEPAHLRPTLDGAHSRLRVMGRIRADLARQGIPIFPTRLYRCDSLPCPWDDPLKAAQVSNQEVGVALVGYALDQYQVIYLHIVGNRSATRSIWATLIQGKKAVLIRADQSLGASPTGNYVSYSAPVLADTGDFRMVILDRRAIDAGSGDTAYLVLPKGQGETDLGAAFAARLDGLLPIPVLPAWGERLYQEGLEHRLVRPLTCGGDVAAAYGIANDRRWVDLVQALFRSGELEV